MIMNCVHRAAFVWLVLMVNSFFLRCYL